MHSGENLFIDARRIGASGTGGDDTEAIQHAIDLIETRGTVYLPPGEYGISSALSVQKSGVHLLGENAVFKKLNSTKVLNVGEAAFSPKR